MLSFYQFLTEASKKKTREDDYGLFNPGSKYKKYVRLIPVVSKYIKKNNIEDLEQFGELLDEKLGDIMRDVDKDPDHNYFGTGNAKPSGFKFNKQTAIKHLVAVAENLLEQPNLDGIVKRADEEIRLLNSRKRGRVKIVEEESELQKLKNELVQLERELSDKNDNINHLKSEIKRLEDELGQNSRRVLQDPEVLRSLEDLRKQLEILSDEINKLREQKTETEKETIDKEDRLNDIYEKDIKLNNDYDKEIIQFAVKELITAGMPPDRLEKFIFNDEVDGMLAHINRETSENYIANEQLINTIKYYWNFNPNNQAGEVYPFISFDNLKDHYTYVYDKRELSKNSHEIGDVNASNKYVVFAKELNKKYGVDIRPQSIQRIERVVRFMNDVLDKNMMGMFPRDENHLEYVYNTKITPDDIPVITKPISNVVKTKKASWLDKFKKTRSKIRGNNLDDSSPEIPTAEIASEIFNYFGLNNEPISESFAGIETLLRSPGMVSLNPAIQLARVLYFYDLFSGSIEKSNIQIPKKLKDVLPSGKDYINFAKIASHFFGQMSYTREEFATVDKFINNLAQGKNSYYINHPKITKILSNTENSRWKIDKLFSGLTDLDRVKNKTAITMELAAIINSDDLLINEMSKGLGIPKFHFKGILKDLIAKYSKELEREQKIYNQEAVLEIVNTQINKRQILQITKPLSVMVVKTNQGMTKSGKTVEYSTMVTYSQIPESSAQNERIVAVIKFENGTFKIAPFGSTNIEINRKHINGDSNNRFVEKLKYYILKNNTAIKFEYSSHLEGMFKISK